MIRKTKKRKRDSGAGDVDDISSVTSSSTASSVFFDANSLFGASSALERRKHQAILSQANITNSKEESYDFDNHLIPEFEANDLFDGNFERKMMEINASARQAKIAEARIALSILSNPTVEELDWTEEDRAQEQHLMSPMKSPGYSELDGKNVEEVEVEEPIAHLGEPPPSNIDDNFISLDVPVDIEIDNANDEPASEDVIWLLKRISEPTRRIDDIFAKIDGMNLKPLPRRKLLNDLIQEAKKRKRNNLVAKLRSSLEQPI